MCWSVCAVLLPLWCWLTTWLGGGGWWWVSTGLRPAEPGLETQTSPTVLSCPVCMCEWAVFTWPMAFGREWKAGRCRAAVWWWLTGSWRCSQLRRHPLASSLLCAWILILVCVFTCVSLRIISRVMLTHVAVVTTGRESRCVHTEIPLLSWHVGNFYCVNMNVW